MKLALVCGDGLPVSGLLTVFRNVIGLLPKPSVLELPIPADLGYSWRPDKPGFFPSGADSLIYPDWLAISRAVPIEQAGFADELTAIRQQVASAHGLSQSGQDELRRHVARLAEPYRRYFSQWLDEHHVDWVCAINMTLSDAVPVTLGLHQAVAERWNARRRGGILFWDHDLFASYSVHHRGVRIYPEHPNEFTPLPGSHPAHRWAVVSDQLAREAADYPTTLRPMVVSNVLPAVPNQGLVERHYEFLAQLGIEPSRPIVLAPVRVFPVKGVEISIALLASLGRASLRRGEPMPYLIVFGSLREDPEYAQEVIAVANAEGVRADVRFLNGVPLGSHQDPTGRWHLDEVDLLSIAKATGGAVFFTPNRPDVESVGLGPALATIANLPCAVTSFNAFAEIYGADFRCVHVEPSELSGAGEEMLDWIIGCRVGAERFLEAMAFNRSRVMIRFPTRPWHELLRELTGILPPPDQATNPVGPFISDATRATRISESRKA